MNVRINESWKSLLEAEFEKDYFINLVDFVKSEYENNTVYPPGSKIFNAFDLTNPEDLKVVILGQDPYHGQGQANGLCFSVNEGITNPPSLINIFKEMKSDLGKEIPHNGNLEYLAKQGVLLLNATLTVRSKQPGSHQNRGWEEFTDASIKKINDLKENLVFILWGAYAQKKGEIIDSSRHFVIKSPHPSPFSANRGFFGSKPFSRTNEFLKSKNIEPVKW